MYFSKTSIVSFSLLASSSLVAGHGAIIGATGDAGGAGSAIGVVPTTPRDGTNRNPFQQDSTRFRGDAAATCGETLGGGANDIAAGTAQVMALNGATLPQISAGGQLMMTVHQVNSDGAGPYKCMIDATGTGTNWQPMTVTQNLPGNAKGRNKDTQLMDQPLTASVDAAQTCTGTVAGQANVCMVRCQNPARAGPFGGCVPVQMAGAAAAAPAAAGAAAPAAAGAAAPAAAGAAAPAAAAGAAAPAAAAGAVAPAAAAGAAVPAAAGTAGTAAPAAGVATGATAPVAGAGVATGATGATGVATGAQTAQGVNTGAQAAQGVNTGANTAAQGVNTGANTAAQGVNTGAQGVNSAATGLQQRAPKKDKTNKPTPALTQDDQEEEVDLVAGDN